MFFSFAVLLSHGCSLGMTQDEVSLLLLGCNFSILHSSFQVIRKAGGHHHTTNIKGVACV
jgi:hypothetical protein